MPKLLRIILVVIAIAVSAWFMSVYTRGSNPFYGDAVSYYSYLPSTFIYHNLDSIYNVPSDRGIPEAAYGSIHDMAHGFSRTPKGYVLNQYTYGIALMELPFFLIAHAYEKITGGQANGYSDMYRYLLHVSALVYGLLGLIVTFSVVRKFFDNRWSFLSVFLIFIGTNLFWFMVKQVGMSHVPIFFLVALLLWLTIRLHEQPVTKYFIAIGFVLGLITLIRPTDIMFAIVPLLYDVYSSETLRKKITFIRTHFSMILLLMLVFCIPIIPQLLYWKWLAGSYVYYSYGQQTFNWGHPRILSGLFYCNNGWLAYSPLMVFSLLGMLLYRGIRPWAWVMWIIFPLYVYVIYSWYCYNYINGLGSRPMIHLYPLLALSFATFIRFVVMKGKVAATILTLFVLLFCAVNISYSRQQALGILASEESNLAYNWSILFRTKNTYKDLVTYDLAEMQPDEKDLVKLPISVCNTYNDSLSPAYFKDSRRPSPFYLMNHEQEFLHNPIRLTYNSKQFQGAKWVKCSGDFMVADAPNSYYRHLLQISFKKGDVFKKWKAVKIINKIDVWNSAKPEVLRIDRWLSGKWGHIWFFVKIPKDLEDGDIIDLSVWNIGKQPIFLDNICLEVYK